MSNLFTMPTITPATKLSFAQIIANERNQLVKQKLEQWMAVHTANTSYLPSASQIVAIAQSSSEKTQLLAWVASLT